MGCQHQWNALIRLELINFDCSLITITTTTIVIVIIVTVIFGLLIQGSNRLHSKIPLNHSFSNVPTKLIRGLGKLSMQLQNLY